MSSDSPVPTAAAGDGAARTSESVTGDSELLAVIREALAPRYIVSEIIGQGGMAVVFRAHEPRHGRDVAIKVVRRELGLSLAVDRFSREIQITAKLQHPNIVSLFDSGTADGLVYFVMPLVEGESLRALLLREGRLSIELALRLARDMADALEYAHSRGIVHRDLKPENILLSSGHAMLADFGIASLLERLVDRQSITDAGLAIGTPAYMSPEQCNTEGSIDGRSDIYSLGCVLYEMLGGEPPFSGRNPLVIMARHASDRLPSIEVLRPDIPPILVTVIEKALAKAPGDRYQTAGAFERALVDTHSTRSRGKYWVAVAAATATLGLALYFALSATTTKLDSNRVAIFPLSERGLVGDDVGGGAAIAVVINAALEHADPLRPLDVSDRLSAAQLADPAAISPADRGKIARQVGAAHYITGIVQAYSDSVIVGLRLYDATGDSLVVQRSTTGSRRASPLHRLGIESVKALLPSLIDPGRAVDLAPLSDRNPSAVALFIQGEREYRRSRFPAALQLYRRALEQDSNLVFAAIKGAQAAYWQDHHAAAELALYATRRDSLLPPRYAAFAKGLHAFSGGRADSAELWVTRAIAAAPGWPEALMQLGEVYFHLVPLRVSLDSLAEVKFREAVASDSAFTPPLVHLSEIALRGGRTEEARLLIKQLRATSPPADVNEHLEMMLACVSRGAARYSWNAAVRSSPRAGLRAAKSLAAAGRQLACAEGAFRALLAASPDVHYGAVLGLQSVLAAQGRTNEVVTLVDSVVKAGVLQALMTAYVVDEAAGLPVAAQAARVAAFAQQRWGPSYNALATITGRSWLLWLFGIWEAGQRNVTTVASLQNSLALLATRHNDPTAELLSNALGAHLRLLALDTTGTISLLRNLRPAPPSDSLSWSLALPLAVERLQLAELLLARRDFSGALSVASVFDHPEPMVYVAFLPASLRIRVQAADSLNRRHEADEYRSRLQHLAPPQDAVRPARVSP